MGRPAVAVVNSSSFGRIFPEHMARLKAHVRVRRLEVSPGVGAERLARLLSGCRAVIASVRPEYGEAFFSRQKDVALIARHGIGFDNVDCAAATRHGVLVTKVPGIVEREAMAEHTVALILAAARRLLPAHLAVKSGLWRERARFVGIELKGRTVGIIGLGNIGGRVARILRRGFGAKVLAYDPYVSAPRFAACGAKRTTLAGLLKRSDIVSLNASLNPTSRNILNAARLSLMRPGALIVNTARGELTDEGALARLMRKGKLGGLGVDAVVNEPAGAGHAFLKLPNAVVVPHIGAYTEESLRAMGEKVVGDVLDVLVRRRRPAELVNPKAWRSPARRI